MKRTLMTSVALSAMIAGATLTAPILDTTFTSQAHAQDATTPAPDAPADDTAPLPVPGADPETGEETGTGTDAPGTDTDTQPETMEEPMDGEAEPNADVDDGMVEDPDAPPMTTTGEDDPSAMSPEDDAAAEQEADEMMSDTPEDSADAGAGGGEMFIDMQGPDEVSANSYIGQTLFNMEDENIGEISNLIFSQDGGISAAVVGVGGFLGIGEKDVGVNFDMIEIQTQPDSDEVRLVIDATEETLTEAPEYMSLDDQAAEQEAPADPAAGGTAPMAPAPAPAPAQ